MMDNGSKIAKFFGVGGIILGLLLLLGGGGYYLFKNLKNWTHKNTPPAEISTPETDQGVFVNDISGVSVIGQAENFPNSISQSENYALREITFGGFEVDMSAEARNVPLKVSDVKGQTVVSKDGKNTSLLFSWKTNKLATSEVTYAKNDGPVKNTLTEEGPGLSHALILNFEPATRYTYYITATDHWGGRDTSDKFSVYTALKSDNIVDLIAEQFRQIFSWMSIKS